MACSHPHQALHPPWLSEQGLLNKNKAFVFLCSFVQPVCQRIHIFTSVFHFVVILLSETSCFFFACLLLVTQFPMKDIFHLWIVYSFTHFFDFVLQLSACLRQDAGHPRHYTINQAEAQRLLCFLIVFLINQKKVTGQN